MNTRNLVSLLLFCSMFLVSCPNVFDPIDNPSGDAQLLSAARACFDQGNLTCAKENYGKITGTTDAEYAAAETAFTILEENGVAMGDFVGAFASGDAAKALSSLALKFANKAGPTTRQTIYGAYKKLYSISSNVELKGLVRFATAIVLAAEILAENTDNTDGVVRKSDFVTTPSGCTSVTTPSCSTNASCDKASNKIIKSVSSENLTPTAVSSLPALDGTLDLAIFQGAMNAIYYAMSNEINASGDFKSGTEDFSKTLQERFEQDPFGSTLATKVDKCYRAILVTELF